LVQECSSHFQLLDAAEFSEAFRSAVVSVVSFAIVLLEQAIKQEPNLMNHKVRWGVLGVASIAVRQVIPAMQQGSWSEVTAIASRDPSKADQAARSLGIPKAYGSYEELLADDEIEAIYNPLPNHLHVPWTIKAAEAGKHVLCEKPIGLNAREAESLLAVRDRTGVKIQEAFMVLTNPQWLGIRELVQSGRIGDLRSISGFFSYFNRDPQNIRNQQGIGGGALMDIGCYPITLSRFIFGAEPGKVLGLIESDPELGIDRLTSAILDFAAGQSIFTCSTQLVPHQRMQCFGTGGQIEVEIPFNAPNDRPTRIFINDGQGVGGGHRETMEFPTCNQYTIQGDRFSQSIRENTSQPIPLEEAVKNMAVIDALFRSAESGCWDAP
jgi:predicted dehydrogenase